MIPPELNTLNKLRDHFGKFGELVNVTPGRLANGVLDEKVVDTIHMQLLYEECIQLVYASVLRRCYIRQHF